MRGIYYLISGYIWGMASMVQAEITPYCWLLDAGKIEVSPTTLKLYTIDKGGQYSVSGTASFSIITSGATRLQLVNGTAITVNDKIEISLNASGIEDLEQKRLWTGTYHLILDVATLNGVFLNRSEDVNSAIDGVASPIVCQ